MKKYRDVILYLFIAAVGLLVVFSVISAFLGPERSGRFFASPPLLIYWAVFFLLLIISLFWFRSFYRRSALFVIHLGAVLIFTGAFLVSPIGHDILNKFTDKLAVKSGKITVFENSQTSEIETDSKMEKLPFAVRLKHFGVEYYEEGMPKRYYSDIDIIEGNSVVTGGRIEVNSPLNYNGYDIYQFGYGQDKQSAVLLIKSDAGSGILTAGYIILLVGILWRFWFGGKNGA